MSGRSEGYTAADEIPVVERSPEDAFQYLFSQAQLRLAAQLSKLNTLNEKEVTGTSTYMLNKNVDVANKLTKDIHTLEETLVGATEFLKNPNEKNTEDALRLIDLAKPETGSRSDSDTEQAQALYEKDAKAARMFLGIRTGQVKAE